MNTTETIQKVRGGDRDAYAQLVMDYQGMLLSYVSFRVPDSDLIEEIVQQTFIRAFERLAEYDTERDFGVWLRMICKFEMMTELRRQAQAKRNIKNYKNEIRHRLFEASIEQCETDDFEDRSKLQECMQGLQQNARNLIELRYALRLPVEEVAKKLGKSVSNVAVSLFRIRGALRKCMLGLSHETEGAL